MSAAAVVVSETLLPRPRPLRRPLSLCRRRPLLRLQTETLSLSEIWTFLLFTIDNSRFAMSLLSEWHPPALPLPFASAVSPIRCSVALRRDAPTQTFEKAVVVVVFI
jgi:hypothetical protein